MLANRFSAHFSSLIQNDNTPIAVAFSGGGDSTALLHILLEWSGQSKSKDIYALIVDHGLRDGSKREAMLAANGARKMGARPEILTWVGVKPDTGVQEKARTARYGLLGEACRRIGVQQLCLGHNQDDQAETLYMRAQKQSGWRGMAGMSMRRHSPLWPELYGVEIVRPLLNVNRAELRAYNSENGLSYIEDPSNEDLKFTRIRTRKKLAKMPEIKQQLLRVGTSAGECLQSEIHTVSLFMFRSVKFFEWGGALVNLNNLAAYPETIIEQALKYLILAVSGGSQISVLEQRKNLAKKLKSENFKGATLGGVRFVPNGVVVLLVRDQGAVLGRGAKPALPALKLPPNTPTIWDGRFKVETQIKGVSIAPLLAHIGKLTKPQKMAIKTIPHSGRAGLPCLLNGGNIFIPYLDSANTDFYITCLIEERLASMMALGKE